MTKKVVAWQYKNKVKQEDISKFELFAEMMDATFDLSHSEDGIGKEVDINIFFEQDEFLNKGAVEVELEKISDDYIELDPIYEHDWQQDCVTSFPAIEVGTFFIHSFEEEAPAEKISLRIPARMAFGTGEHATTKGCLYLYDELKKKGYKFKNGLDMGCGSAILAMCANKCENVDFLGVDIDLTSVDIANENLVENNIASSVTIIHGDGFNDPEVTRKAPYDLVFANILKNPLLEMSRDLVACLDKGGIAILSGFKEIEQKAEIINKYVGEFGLVLVDEFNQDSWSAICLKKEN